MASRSNLQLYLNTDFNYLFTIYDAAEASIVDTSTWAMSWIVKTYAQDTDASALLTKTTSSGITVSGTYNATPASNTQRVNVDIDDSDTTSVNPGDYVWELRRTDAGNETVLATGTITILASAHGF